VIIAPLGDSPTADQITEALKQNAQFNLKLYILSEDPGPKGRTPRVSETDTSWVSKLPVLGRVGKILQIGSYRFRDCISTYNITLQLSNNVIHYQHSIINQALVSEYAAYLRSWETKCILAVQGPVEDGGFGFLGLNPSQTISRAQLY
jgi:hypothetical protein